MNLSLNLDSFDFPTHLKPFMGIFWDITHPYKLFASKYIFFVSAFSSQTLTIHRTAGEERGPSFISLYHFHPLKNIDTLICNFACGTSITYFYSQRLCLPDCYTIRFTTLSNYHLGDWLMMQCLFSYLMNWY